MISNLAKRSLVAAVGIPALVFISYFGGYWLYFFCLLISILSSWELAAMLMARQIRLSKKLITLLPIVIVSMFQFSRFGRADLMIVFILFMLTAVYKLIETGIVDYVSHLATSILAAIYPGFFVSFAILMHRDFAPVGWVFLLFVFVNTWIADTFAYGFGRWLGKRKLAPTISPKKTWAGFIGSFAGGLITPFLAIPFLPNWSLAALMMLSLVATLFGQIGDLIESAIKRDCGIKDSSNLIPGHGGVLDRFDSFVIALPAVYFMLRILT
jgi:phosphatidate cytidylyltransferase